VINGDLDHSHSQKETEDVILLSMPLTEGKKRRVKGGNEEREKGGGPEKS